MGTHHDQLLESDRLRVRFHFREDRYAHEVWVAAEGAWIALVASVEGTPSQDWPASPPLQSLHFENHGRPNQSALLVGMAGKSHWSASVELDPHGDCARFDIACRVRGAADPRLGSAYRALPSVSVEGPREGVLAFGSASSASVALELAVIDEPPQASLEIFDRGGRIVVAAGPGGDGSRTVRWRYALRVIDVAG